MRLTVLFVVAAADPARRELGKRKQGAKALAAMTKECRAVLRDNDMDWLLEPFTCSARMKTSQTQLVLGTGLGATGTRSVAAAVDALGIPTCHRFITTADLLMNSSRHDLSAFERFGPRAYFDTPLAHIWPRLACAFPRYRVVHTCVHTTRTRYGRNFGAHHCEGPAYHEPQKSIVRCLEYGTRCPQLAESQAAFRRNEAAVARVPADRRLVLDINRPESMDARALARYLGRPVPAFKAIPISALNFCSYDGILRGPFGFRLSADELKHSSIRSIDHK